MSQTQQMPPARRRPVPGMSGAVPAPPPPSPAPELELTSTERSGEAPVPATSAPDPRPAATTLSNSRPLARSSAEPGASPVRQAGVGEANRSEGAHRGRRAADYATTRLVNFRIPVDLHDRYRQLVRDAELEYPRLRHPSLTELVIALLEEGPETVEEAAALIRRKRAAEHAEEASA